MIYLIYTIIFLFFKTKSEEHAEVNILSALFNALKKIFFKALFVMAILCECENRSLNYEK